MDTFEDEVLQAFQEVATQGMPVSFRLTNERYSGVVQSTASMMVMREPGYEPVNEVIIYAPRLQFQNSPDHYLREIVQIDSGPQVGMYVCVAVNTDMGHFILTCKPSDT